MTLGSWEKALKFYSRSLDLCVISNKFKRLHWYSSESVWACSRTSLRQFPASARWSKIIIKCQVKLQSLWGTEPSLFWATNRNTSSLLWYPCELLTLYQVVIIWQWLFSENKRFISLCFEYTEKHQICNSPLWCLLLEVICVSACVIISVPMSHHYKLGMTPWPKLTSTK